MVRWLTLLALGVPFATGCFSAEHRCATGADCAAGVCVSVGTAAYCSRPCGTGDRCPTNFHCQKTTDQKQVCVRVR